MNQNVIKFVKAFQSLSASEKAQVIEIAKALNDAGPINESRVMRSLGLEASSTTINFAPAPGACPACGK
ncbi:MULTISPECIES: hypothetical protein [unclassified Pseudoalteromonas]|uniref:hypothetical protein n=1 Tax=unclassified Pseudoalteromonas TaxID=194690 RepID=UPI00386B0715